MSLGRSMGSPSPPSEERRGERTYIFPPQGTYFDPVSDAEDAYLKKNASWAISLATDLFLSAVALCFVALAALAVYMKGHPTGSSMGNRIEEAMRLGPTIYPVIFAALLSRSLKSIGRFLAQRQIRLETLWALMNTNTLSDPISHILTLRTSVLLWTLVPLWALSPLGGQGSLRLMHHVNSTTTEIQQLRYMDTGPLSNAFTYWSTDETFDGAGPQSMRDVFIGSLMQSRDTKTGPLDQWRNVKIPRMDALNASTRPDSDGWLSVEHEMEVESYSSLLGVPIVGLAKLQDEGDLQFTLETTYVELSCPSVSLGRDGSVNSFNMTCPGCDPESEFRLVRCIKLLGSPFPIEPGMLINRPPLSDPGYSNPQRLLFRSPTSGGMSIATCTVTQRMVESMVVCVDKACSVTKARPSRTDHRSVNITSFDYWAARVLDMITNANTPPAGTYLSATMGVSSSELFMCDPRKAPVQGLQHAEGDCVDEGGLSKLSNLDPKLFAARASILLNTGIHTHMAPAAFLGDLPTSNLTVYGPPHIPAEGLRAISNKSTLAKSQPFSLPIDLQRLTAMNPPFLAASTNATLLRYTEVYQPNYVWVALLAVSAVFLACLGVVGACLRIFTIPPNMFDPVMGLTFTNPYLPACAAPGPLDAVDRLKSIRDERVRIGRVGDGGMGKGIAFGDVSHVAPLT